MILPASLAANLLLIGVIVLLRRKLSRSNASLQQALDMRSEYVAHRIH